MKGIGFGNPLSNMDAAGSEAASARVKNLQARTGAADDLAGLRKAAREFEGVFLNNLMKAMRRTVPDNELFNSAGPTKFYQQMLDAEMAQGMTGGHGGMGIAEMLVNQFRSTVDGAEETSRTVQAPTPSVPLPELMDRYRSMGAVTGEVADRLRLQMRAAEAGPAVADTLQRFEAEIHRAAGRQGLDPALVLAVVIQESGGDPLAVSSRGATGLMQLMPETARELGVRDATSPSQNLAGGSRYLGELLRQYEGDLDLALAAYNAGPGNVQRAGRAVPDFPETRQYIHRVRELYERLGGTNMARNPVTGSTSHSSGEEQ